MLESGVWCVNTTATQYYCHQHDLVTRTGYSEVPFEKWHLIKWEKVGMGKEFSAISKLHTLEREMNEVSCNVPDV